MLYEMVTGMQPYSAESTERVERMIRSRIAAPPAPDPCPEPLRRILIKAIAPDPAVRYQSARELADDLQAFRRGEPVAAVLEDLEVTRRTVRGDEEVTRRTSARKPTLQAGTPAPRKPEKQRGNWFFALMRAVALAVMASVVYGSYVVVSDYELYRHGQQLEREVETEQVTDLEQIWNKWTELSSGNPSSFFLHGPRAVVKQKFVAAADHVIDTYRNSEAQPVYEKDWERARTMAARALAIEPDDSVRGKVRLCEGHLARINGTTHHSVSDLNRAVEKFTEAQRLMPGSPDPELGLARVYVYGLRDIDKAYEALQQAQKRGYKLGNREKAQLADGYRERADRLWWDSRNVRGLPAEKDQIQRAADDYKRALELYQSVAPYGNAYLSIVRVQLSLDSVNYRLQQIE
jgi:tetratricopeptide (TPR) repeat protein